MAPINCEQFGIYKFSMAYEQANYKLNAKKFIGKCKANAWLYDISANIKSLKYLIQSTFEMGLIWIELYRNKSFWVKTLKQKSEIYQVHSLGKKFLANQDFILIVLNDNCNFHKMVKFQS